jgi:hypothetical protein
MGFFDKILAKLGFGGTAENPTTIPTSGTTPTSSSTPPDRFISSQAGCGRRCRRTTGEARSG